MGSTGWKMLIAQDKILHLIAGGVTCAMSYLAPLPVDLCLESAFVVGLAKEIYDIPRTGFDVEDLMFTTLGGFSVRIMF